ncbi:MAG: DNA-binding response regulator [Pedosphaera sp.]|nr:DNA-binding response regulator [Pedosphaera sp.]
MKLFGKWQKAPPPPGEEAPFASTEASTSRPSDSIGKGRKILVVDDNQVVLKAFELKLQACGFEVLTATEGAAAVSAARQTKPDLIVLDINYPPDVGSSGLQWDGFTIMQWMGRFQEVANIPVIIITSGDAEKFKSKAAAAGAVDFFTKPINFDQFLVSVHRAITQGKPPKTP